MPESLFESVSQSQKSGLAPGTAGEKGAIGVVGRLLVGSRIPARTCTLGYPALAAVAPPAVPGNSTGRVDAARGRGLEPLAWALLARPDPAPSR